MTPPHPVHSGTIRPSVGNCRGCQYLNWEYLRPDYKRRICYLSGRIPGNIACPLAPPPEEVEAV